MTNPYPLKSKPTSRLSGLQDSFGAETLVQASYEDGTLTLKLHDIDLEDFQRLCGQLRFGQPQSLHIQLLSAT